MSVRLSFALVIGGLLLVGALIGFALLNGPLRPHYRRYKTERVEVTILHPPAAPPAPPPVNAAQ